MCVCGGGGGGVSEREVLVKYFKMSSAEFLPSRTLTYCRLKRCCYILEQPNFNFRYVQGKMALLFANSRDPCQTLQNAASDLGLHCLPINLLGVSRLQWVNMNMPIQTVHHRCQT